MNDRAQHLPNISAPLFVRPPWMAEVQSAKPSVNEASFTGQTQERLFCLMFPGRPGLVARKIMAIFVQAGLP